MKKIDNGNLNPDQKALAELIKDRFKNINQASKQTGFTRQTIYSWIEKGEISDIAKDVLRGRGWDPETLVKADK